MTALGGASESDIALGAIAEGLSLSLSMALLSSLSFLHLSRCLESFWRHFSSSSYNLEYREMCTLTRCTVCCTYVKMYVFVSRLSGARHPETHLQVCSKNEVSLPDIGSLLLISALRKRLGASSA